uniref:Uncharacterized protein n=1 Tax=Ornithorhynchus anatinus TaxID=9258 RepID=F7CJL7_ORNAN
MENILKVKNKILDSKNTGREIPLFQAAKENDMKSLMKLIGDASTDPLEKGAFGERVLHVAALYNNHEILIALLDAYPFLINYPMECETYKGETALHIAIINQNLAVVRELLARKADIHGARATGDFFAPGKRGQCYYGEYALSFAACIGNEEILQLLVESGAPLHAQDKQGNTVFHMLVLHPNKMMACKIYDFLISLISKEKVPYLESIENKEGFTPLKLAAHEGNPKMFKYFIGKKRLTFWTFGPVISSLYDLTGIDTWEDQKSVMDIICTSKNKAARHLLEVTPLKELLHHKWTKFGHKYFLLWTVLSVAYTLIFTACCIYRPINPVIKNGENATLKVMKKINEAYSMSDDFVRMAGEITIVLGAFLILLIEIPQLFQAGHKVFFGTATAGGPFYISMMVYACLIVIIMILRILASEGETVVMSLALVNAWCNIIYFARGFKLLGPLCIMIQKMLFGDLMRFCTILIIVIIGFGADCYNYLTAGEKNPKFSLATNWNTWGNPGA